MKKMFSIVVPTRDRPDFLRACLQSIRLQSFMDYEVIVSDNCIAKPAKEVFDELADGHFRYVKPATPLPMAEHWEFACEQASGEYVLVLIDKTLLHPSALGIAKSIIERGDVDVLTWWNEPYSPASDLSAALAPGVYSPCYPSTASQVREIDGLAEIARRFTLDVRRGTEGVRYFYGKICFGCYRQSLLSRMRKEVGRLFFPLSPDYTSMMSALSMANRLVEVQRPLLMSVATSLSNGAQAAVKPQHALKFVGEYSSDYGASKWPIRGLYASQHNCVAFDYAHMKERLGNRVTCSLNLPNLLIRAREDLDGVHQWSDMTERGLQYGLWERSFRKLPKQDQCFVEESLRRSAKMERRRELKGRLRKMAARMPIAESLVRSVLGRPAPRMFKNIIDSLEYADSYYSAAARASIDRPSK